MIRLKSRDGLKNYLKMNNQTNSVEEEMKEFRKLYNDFGSQDFDGRVSQEVMEDFLRSALKKQRESDLSKINIKKKRCDRVHYIKPCNHVEVIAYNKAIDDILQTLKDKEGKK